MIYKSYYCLIALAITVSKWSGISGDSQQGTPAE